LVCHGEHVSGSGRTREARKTGTACRGPTLGSAGSRSDYGIEMWKLEVDPR
jgi:hypothetical protein